MLKSMLLFVCVFLIGWLGLGCGLVYLFNLVRFQAPFSGALVREGIYDAKTHRSVLRTSWIGGAVIVLGSLALLLWLDAGAGTMGLVMTALGVLVGLLRSRHILGRCDNNVVRFVRTHIVCMDREKTAAFLQREYGLDLDRLVPKA